MANNRLVPEKRVNKLGVAVTKYVLPDDGGKSAAASFPQPQVKTKRSEAERRNQLAVSLGVPDKHHAQQERIYEELNALPVSIIDAAQQQINEHLDSDRVCGAVYRAITAPDADEQAITRRLSATSIESMYDKHLPESPLGLPTQCFEILESVCAFLNGYEEAPEFTPENERDIRALEYCVAASDLHMRTSGESYRSYHTSTCLNENPALADVFLEFPDRAEELAEFVIANGRDTGRALQYLRGENMILADGAL